MLSPRSAREARLESLPLRGVECGVRRRLAKGLMIDFGGGGGLNRCYGGRLKVEVRNGTWPHMPGMRPMDAFSWVGHRSVALFRDVGDQPGRDASEVVEG